jgi:hypothetical protein
MFDDDKKRGDEDEVSEGVVEGFDETEDDDDEEDAVPDAELDE